MSCARYVYVVYIVDYSNEYCRVADPCYVNEEDGTFTQGPEAYQTTPALFNNEAQAQKVADSFAAANPYTNYGVAKIPVFGSRALSLG